MLFSVFRTIIVYLIVILAMRLMGKRQLGELQPAELVTTFLISNVASICIDEPDLPLLSSLAPIFLIAILEIFNSTLAWYHPRYAELLFGKPITVMRNGTVDQAALGRMRITVSDLAEALRGKDIFDPEQVAWAVIEPNGSLSVAPVPPQDQPPPMLPLLVDGQLYRDNLYAMGLDTTWLAQTLGARDVRRDQVLLLLYDGEKEFWITKKAAQNGRPKND